MPFEVESRTVDFYTANEFRHAYFEMIFILSGTGVQIINSNRLAYSEDKLFIIFPQDVHGFEITETTHFFSLRFNESYFSEQPAAWLRKLEYIFHNHDHMPGCILKNVADKPLIRSLTEALIREQNNKSVYQDDVVQQLINTIITIAARNMSIKNVYPQVLSAHPLSLQGYVHRNIYQPELLRADVFASFFNISPTYLSELFKSKTGIALKNYIDSYRLQLIEARLKHTDNRLNEIASEFGLTDTSHLNKIFKRDKGISPSAFRAYVRKGM